LCHYTIPYMTVIQFGMAFVALSCIVLRLRRRIYGDYGQRLGDDAVKKLGCGLVVLTKDPDDS
jgi:hypothetical protein